MMDHLMKRPFSAVSRLGEKLSLGNVLRFRFLVAPRNIWKGYRQIRDSFAIHQFKRELHLPTNTKTNI